MQGLVTLDFGNTHPHAGLFQKAQGSWQLIKVVPLRELQLYLGQLQMTPHNTSIVICEVKPQEDLLKTLMEQGFHVTKVKEYWRGKKFAGMPVHYAHTLGEDRLITAFYVYKKLKSPTLVLDAGTFVTMDVVTSNGFEGGYIIPGTKAYFEAYQNGEQLKSVSVAPSIQNSLPQDTQQAIAGSYSAFAALAKKLLKDHLLTHLLITGGSASLWRSFFEKDASSLVVESEDHLIHWALHYWMTTQIEPL